MNQVREQTALLQQFATALCFYFTFCRKPHINPTSEEILSVPLALAMAEQDQVEHGESLFSNDY
jgi:hypothetical protein